LRAATKQKANDLILQQGLPNTFMQDAESFLLPVADQIYKLRNSGPPLLIGIQGTQGSGKSTSAEFLKLFLENEYALRVAICSIDDFYLSQDERRELAAKIHPLLSTRGVPGTHHVESINTTFQQFRAGQALKLPQFDKAQDNPKPSSEDLSTDDQLDVLIFEGWCVGIPEQSAEHLVTAVNTLEREEDADGSWRQFVNQQLQSDYAALFKQLDLLVVLQAPSFASVFNWRQLQELKLVARLEREGKSSELTLTAPQLERFIQHYQRLTEHGLNSLESLANFIIQLDDNHRFTALRQKLGKHSQ